MVILTLNCGSSSAKYQVYDWDRKDVLGVGIVERIGQKESNLEQKTPGQDDYEALKNCPDHKAAVAWIMQTLVDPDHGCIKDMSLIGAVGHRMVHGAETFTKSVIVNEEVLSEMESVNQLAPLHNPANLTGIRAAQEVLPDVPHCAIMDTAWHQTMPSTSFMYAVPYDWYKEHKVRRYGFHGTSYIYTAKRASVLLGKDPMKTNLIIAHIGNGSSICAVKDGKSYDTSMGMTPLEGLMMGTRSGDMDPAIVTYMMHQKNLSPAEMDSTLNKKSGILGITGKYIDRRDVHTQAENGNEQCLLAQDMETYRIRKYVGAYLAAVGRIDAIVFTAGVGEMNPTYRWKSLRGLDALGIKIDEKKNTISRSRNAETCISTDDSPVKIYVIPTDEELVMTEDSYALMQGTYDVHTSFTYSFQSPDYRNKARDAALPADIAKNPDLEGILAK